MSVFPISDTTDSHFTSTSVTSQSTTANTNQSVRFDHYLDRSGTVSASGSDLNAIFKKASETYGIDEDLLKAVAKTESNFTANARSHSGAMGIMQLMPSTAQALGVSHPYDPEENIMGGARLLASHLKKYNGNVSYALAAYNCGSSAVDKYGTIPPYQETQNYVNTVLQYYSNGVTSPAFPARAAATTGSATEVSGSAPVLSAAELKKQKEDAAWDKKLARYESNELYITSNVSDSVSSSSQAVDTTRQNVSSASLGTSDFSDYSNQYLNTLSALSGNRIANSQNLSTLSGSSLWNLLQSALASSEKDQ